MIRPCQTATPLSWVVGRLSQTGFPDLSGFRFRECIHELTVLWNLVSGQLPLTITEGLPRGHRHTRLRDDEDLANLTSFPIRHPDYGHLEYFGMAGIYLLNLGRIDILATAERLLLNTARRRCDEPSQRGFEEAGEVSRRYSVL